jgi:hypothetical protein
MSDFFSMRRAGKKKLKQALIVGENLQISNKK